MSARYWLEFWLNNGAAWFLTYLLFSTWIFGAVALFVRLDRVSAATENALWRVVVGVVPLLAALRIAVEHVEPVRVAAGPEAMTVRGPLGWAVIYGSVLAAAAALWLTGRLGMAASAERGRLARREPVQDTRLLDELRRVAARAGRPVPRLSCHAGLLAPIAIGRHEICIPAGIFDALSPDGARAVLAHELAHLVRRDTAWATWLHLLDRLFFVQPLQRWASRRIRETSEFLADDFAVRHSAGPDHLVAALTTFARASGGGVAVSGFAPGSLLLRRVERVLRGASAEERVRWATLALLVTILVALAWFSPAVVPACDCRFRGALSWLGASGLGWSAPG